MCCFCCCCCCFYLLHPHCTDRQIDHSEVWQRSHHTEVWLQSMTPTCETGLWPLSGDTWTFSARSWPTPNRKQRQLGWRPAHALTVVPNAFMGDHKAPCEDDSSRYSQSSSPVTTLHVYIFAIYRNIFISSPCITLNWIVSKLWQAVKEGKDTRSSRSASGSVCSWNFVCCSEKVHQWWRGLDICPSWSLLFPLPWGLSKISPSAPWGSWGRIISCLPDTLKVLEGIGLPLTTGHQPKPL